MSDRRESLESRPDLAAAWTGIRQSIAARLSGRRLLAACGLAASAAFLTGCEVDSFLDPSVVGRWEHTPTIMPVLERIDVIERDTGQYVEYTQVMPEDLIPEPTDYRVQPSDGLVIEIEDFVQGGQAGRYERLVDARGFIDLPQLGRILVLNKTRVEIENDLAAAIKAARILDEPLVTVQIPGQRQQTFGVFGRVQNPGRYVIPRPDYKLLEAITDAGGVDPSTPNIYIIRQVALSDVVKSGVRRPGAGGNGSKTGTPQQGEPASPMKGEDLINLIEELTAPSEPAPKPETPKPEGEAPAAPPGEGVIGMSALSAETPRPIRRGSVHASASLPSAGALSQPDDQPPPIDLVDEDRPRAQPVPGSGAAPGDGGRIAAGQWVFLNGEWVQVVASKLGADGLPEGEDPLQAAGPAANLVTQRVIEVPVKPLLQGVAQYNIVLRPGDVVSITGPDTGIVYAMGPGISRPGTYNMPPAGQFTFIRLVASAGGLSAIGIPERTDITRMVGQNRQATIRVDARAIFEGTAPDIILKPDDVVNFGTNFFATPLAIIRNGFRMSYGFGFLIDRNFGNDIFGAPPVNQFGQ